MKKFLKENYYFIIILIVIAFLTVMNGLFVEAIISGKVDIETLEPISREDENL